jgi:hypothetical protein
MPLRRLPEAVRGHDRPECTSRHGTLELIVRSKVLERFRKGNASRRAQGDRLEAAIKKIDEAHVGPVPLRGEAAPGTG